jgi:hypothetical protein
MRALEEYAASMYGLDGVVGWTRLQAVIPTEYQTIIDGQRLYRDFWVNSCFVCFALLTEAILLCFLRPARIVVGLVLIVILVLLIWWTYESANTAAQRFGDYVRSAYDLYIDDLRQKLRLPKHDDPIGQRRIWFLTGQAYAYRSKHTLDKLHKSAESETMDSK